MSCGSKFPRDWFSRWDREVLATRAGFGADEIERSIRRALGKAPQLF